MPQVHVDLPNAYTIHLGPGLLGRVGSLMRDLEAGETAVVVTHPELPPAYRTVVRQSLQETGFRAEMALVPQGEASKCLDALAGLYARFADLRLDRRSTVVALGGGVIGDLAGFAAATYLRGLALVQVPTTLLAQVDSSIGGKTAIDLPAGKNLVGAFHQPRLVVADIDTLQTLPEVELRSGLAEVVKYGIIADPELFAFLEQNADRARAGDPETLTRLVVRSCEIKADVVRQDPNEQGLRAILNYGHTVGHALEAVLGYGVLPHGEAVAIGMSAAARLAARLGLLAPGAAVRQDALLQRLGLPTLSSEAGSIRFPGDRTSAPGEPGRLAHEPAGAGTMAHRLPPTAALLSAMALDKKTMGGRLRFVLARDIGAVELREVEASDVAAALEATP